MHSSHLLVSLAAAASASEIVNPNLQAANKRALEARQTTATTSTSQATVIASGSAFEACISTARSLHFASPTPTAELLAWHKELERTVTATDFCQLETPTPPASLASQYSEWVSKVKAWETSHDVIATSLWTHCPGLHPTYASDYDYQKCTAGGKLPLRSGLAFLDGKEITLAASPTNGTGNGTIQSSPPAPTQTAGAPTNIVAAGLAVLEFLGATVVL